MVSINYPTPSFRIKREKDKPFIFDPLRKKWLAMTPEEWVRQNFIQYLLQVKNYPATLIALEKKIKLGELIKRFDILIYDRDHRPFMMIECKAPEIPLDSTVLDQVLRYNISTPVEYLVITNGDQTYAWQKDAGGLKVLKEIPAPVV